jgi:hypothetical protein
VKSVIFSRCGPQLLELTAFAGCIFMEDSSRLRVLKWLLGAEECNLQTVKEYYFIWNSESNSSVLKQRQLGSLFRIVLQILQNDVRLVSKVLRFYALNGCNRQRE